MPHERDFSGPHPPRRARLAALAGLSGGSRLRSGRRCRVAEPGNAAEDGTDGTDPGEASPAYTFAISASPTDPFVNEAPPAAGPYDLYLWLVCSNRGARAFQAGFSVEGDQPLSTFFTPDPASGAAYSWTEQEELALALVGCPSSATRLGVLHLDGSGAGARVNLRRVGSDTGAVDCTTSVRHGFESIGFSSDGAPPAHSWPEDGCSGAGGPA